MEAVSSEKTYKCNGSIYKIVPIVDEAFTEEDYSTACDYTQIPDKDMYIGAMVESIKQGLCFSVYRDSKRVGFMYNVQEGDNYIGAAIHLSYDTCVMLLGLRRAFEINNAHKILVYPFDNLRYFISLASGTSIRSHHCIGSGLSIVKKDMWPKGERLCKYLQIEEL